MIGVQLNILKMIDPRDFFHPIQSFTFLKKNSKGAHPLVEIGLISTKFATDCYWCNMAIFGNTYICKIQLSMKCKTVQTMHASPQNWLECCAPHFKELRYLWPWWCDLDTRFFFRFLSFFSPPLSIFLVLFSICYLFLLPLMEDIRGEIPIITHRGEAVG